MSPNPRTFVATADQSGLTVLAALRQLMPATSWSAVRKLMTERKILVNAALCVDEARRIKTGEAITISNRALPTPPSQADVRLVFLDECVVVVDKPSGMVTLRHAAERGWSAGRKWLQPALDDVVPEIIAREENAPRRHRRRPERVLSVHRLDRDASGLLVFARTATARENLIRQFKKHTVERVYMAIAQGDVAPRTIESFLAEDRGDGRRGSIFDPRARHEGEVKRAVTHVRPLERLDGFTLVECRLETGRTHQIRIHLSEAGHPLYGDPKYGNIEPRDTATNVSPALPAARLALHAAALAFDHPAHGKRLRFESPPPVDLAALIERLRAST